MASATKNTKSASRFQFTVGPSMSITSTPWQRTSLIITRSVTPMCSCPLTINGALIQGNELSIRSPRFWSAGQAHVTCSNQTADGFGGINGGLTNFNPREGYFALDHDQRNTANVGFDANLPAAAFASMNVYYGSGFSNG